MILLITLILASPVSPESRQLLLSVSHDWGATRAIVRRYERAGGTAPWRPVGDPLPASLGRTGLAWGRGLQEGGLPGPTKREGDGKSPAGVFLLRGATGYAPAPPPGTRLPYTQARPGLKCVDDPASDYYNQVVELTEHKDWKSEEDMLRKDELYRLVVIVGHNDDPRQPGAGSCMFLHIRAASTSVTAGCTAFDAEGMETIVRWLDPASRPVLVQLPESALGSLAGPWKLP